MRRFLLCGALVGVFLVGAACERSQTPVQPQPGDEAGITIEYVVMHSVLMEAESGTVTAPMEVFEDEVASEGKYVLAPEGPNHEEISVGGDVACPFMIDEAGDYVLWLRAKWCCACGDSVGVLLDGVDLGTVQDSVHETWHWVPLQRHRPHLDKGQHTIIITNREDGAAVDQILLTQDRDYRPVDIEKLSGAGRSSGIVVLE